MRFRAVDRKTLQRTFPPLLQRFGRSIGRPPGEWDERDWESAAHLLVYENAALRKSRRYLRKNVAELFRTEDAKRHAKKISKLGTDARHAGNRDARSQAIALYLEGQAEGRWKSKNQAAEAISKIVNRACKTVRDWLIENREQRS